MATITARTIQNDMIELEGKTIDDLKHRLRGILLRSGEPGYDEARKVYNGMINRRPALIARCTGAGDVIACVQFAREHNLLVSVRGGGHSVAGNAVCDDGLMFDLSLLRGIRVDPVGQTVRAEPGLTWADFDRETQAFGLATTGGLFSPTGIAGLTLGGGLGWLHGLHGLACDNLLSADVVTADGRLLTASETEHPDLFWGLRGGGGNFGIVTSLVYRLHPVGPVLAGELIYPIARAAEVLRFYREFLPESPDAIRTDIGLVTAPDGNLVIGVIPCYIGTIAEGERIIEPLRRLGPVADMVRPLRYCGLQTMMDEMLPPGRMNYWKSSFLPALDDGAIDTLVACGRSVPSPTSLLTLEPICGAASRVSPDATAFPHRGTSYSLLILATWTDPAASDRHIRWARESWEAMKRFTAGRVYVNYLSEGEDRVQEAYGANYGRLAALKSTYDPKNFFRVNQNIPPEAEKGRGFAA